MEKSSEFVEKARLIGLERDLADHRHELRMKELELERDNQRELHNMILERGRITRAEERKMLEYRMKMEGSKWQQN